MFFLDPKFLNDLANEHQKNYSQALPFPHIVIDDFLPTDVLDKILNNFPQPEQIDWYHFHNAAEIKLASQGETQLGDFIRFFFYHLNSSVFINFLEVLTGIDGLIGDPHFEGGGLHQIKRGGYLKIHADFNYHPKLRLDRRLNILIYLNKDWQEEYGGHLELWSRDMTRCEKKILPVFNRCVIFNTTDFSYHGHPDPLTCPEGITRKSLAFYYYTNGRPAEEVSIPHTTLFQERPNEMPAFPVKTIVKSLIPPIFIYAGRSLKKYTTIKSKQTDLD